MKAILVIILIWAGISFIYSKVKKVSFIHAMINVPLIIIKVFFEEAASNSKRHAREFRRNKQYDAAEKMNEASDAAENFSKMASSFKDAADQKFNKDE